MMTEIQQLRGTLKQIDDDALRADPTSVLGRVMYQTLMDNGVSKETAMIMVRHTWIDVSKRVMDENYEDIVEIAKTTAILAIKNALITFDETEVEAVDAALRHTDNMYLTFTE